MLDLEFILLKDNVISQLDGEISNELLKEIEVLFDLDIEEMVHENIKRQREDKKNDEWLDSLPVEEINEMFHFPSFEVDYESYSYLNDNELEKCCIELMGEDFYKAEGLKNLKKSFLNELAFFENRDKKKFKNWEEFFEEITE